MADSIDTINGHPIVVVNAFWCDHEVEACIPGPTMPLASPRDASSIAGGLAEALGVPLAEHAGFRSPQCPWPDSTSSGAGLYAQFIGPPFIDGDSAVVELATGCAEGGAAFEQIHEFFLRKRDDEWLVLRRRMLSIT